MAFINTVENNPILKQMDEGFDFFLKWWVEKKAEGMLRARSWYCIICLYIGCSITQTTGRKFLSWKRWDLMKLMYWGFKDFITLFLKNHEGYVIYPVRLNGSAIETVFSQLKGITHGHLSARNYSSAVATLVTRGSIQNRKKRIQYRNAPLYFRKGERTNYKMTLL